MQSQTGIALCLDRDNAHVNRLTSSKRIMPSIRRSALGKAWLGVVEGGT